MNFVEASMTTIDGAHTVGDTTVDVGDASEFRAPGVVRVWKQTDVTVLRAVISFTGITSNQLTGCVWNFDGHTDVNLSTGDYVAQVGSHAHTPFGRDLVTGDSQTFLTGLGDWVEVGGGTVTWLDYGVSFHPIVREFGSTHVLEYTGAVAGDYLELPVSGTFTAGRRYIVVLALMHSEDAEWELGLGDFPSGDYGGASVVSFQDNDLAHLRSAIWIPQVDFVDPSVGLRYVTGGVSDLWLGGCLVAEAFEAAISDGIAVTSGVAGSLLQLVDDQLSIRAGNIAIRSANALRMEADATEFQAAGDLNLISDTNIALRPSAELRTFDANPGLDSAARPALETATTEGEVIAGYNLIRTMLISLGLATDGD